MFKRDRWKQRKCALPLTAPVHPKHPLLLSTVTCERGGSLSVLLKHILRTTPDFVSPNLPTVLQVVVPRYPLYLGRK